MPAVYVTVPGRQLWSNSLYEANVSKGQQAISDPILSPTHVDAGQTSIKVFLTQDGKVRLEGTVHFLGVLVPGEAVLSLPIGCWAPYTILNVGGSILANGSPILDFGVRDNGEFFSFVAYDLTGGSIDVTGAEFRPGTSTFSPILIP